MAVQLSGVAETLLIPLQVQWQENRRAQPLMTDPKVDEVIARVAPDFSKFVASPAVRATVILRKLIIDDIVRRHMAETGPAVVVNLGSGLCTRFDRVDDGAVTWIDVDQEAVAPVWHQGFDPAGERRQFVAGTIDDPGLIERLPLPEGARVLFVLEGVSMYLNDARLKGLAHRIAARVPGAILVFDCVSSLLAIGSPLYPSMMATGTRFTWSLDRPARLRRWGRGYSLVANESLAVKATEVWGNVAWLARINPLARSAYRVIALRLGKPPTSAGDRAHR